MSGVFLVSYGVLRFAVEFTREPDYFLGLPAMGFSMGQWLSLPMIVGGVVMLAWAYLPQARAAPKPVWGCPPDYRFRRKMRPFSRGGSSAGRASRSQCEGRGFDPLPLHHIPFRRRLTRAQVTQVIHNGASYLPPFAA